MWRETEYRHDGPAFRMPYPNPQMPTRNVLPKPWKKPHPPMWVAAGNPPTYAKAASLGLGVLGFNVAAVRDMEPMVKAYKDAVGSAEPVGDYVNDNVAVVSQFLCLEDREEARDWMTKSGGGYHNSLLFRYLDTFPRPEHIPQWPEVLPPLDRAQVDYMIEANGSMVGDPDDCVTAVERLQAIGCDQVLMGPSSTLWPHDVCAQSVELFGKQVIPEFDTDPEHSTSRYRRDAATRNRRRGSAGS
jgi:alkanesulfonate monooxygenase SsuD/methylene tetrahydromethanopterin reductase-like flavin-dependent oxidoreductase (luciferase family)